MRRKYPKFEDFKFVLCEQVRPELNKKLTYLGVFAGDEIIFYPKTPGEFPYTLPALAFVFVGKGGAGDFDVTCKLIRPDGTTKVDIPLNPIVLVENVASIYVVQMANLKFDSDGTYAAMLSLNKRNYVFPFRISSAATEK